MNNYDTKYINHTSNNSIIPYDSIISSLLPNLLNKYKINDITFLDNQIEMKREMVNKYLTNDKSGLYTIIYKTYQNNKLIDIFFLLKNKENSYHFIDDIKEIYSVDKEISKDLFNYKTFNYNNHIVKILIINNLEYNLENNGFGWASMYEIINLNQLNEMNIDELFINFINNNIHLIK